MSLLLAGDVGGTKTTLACYRAGRDHLELLRRASFPSRSFSCLKEVLDAFMEGFDAPLDAAVLGVAGPVVDGTATITNLPWKVDERELAVILKTARTSVVNDLVAVSYGILDLSAGDLFALNDVPRDPRGPIAVIAPGTGLGEAYLTWDGASYRAHPSEGGHADFAPTDEMQISLLRWMLRRHDHVSVERVCSGSGIPNLYAFLKEQGAHEEPERLALRLGEAPDPAVVIRENAQDPVEGCDLSRAAMELFVKILGAEAGNLALKLLPTGGLFLAGGLPPRIIPMLETGAFMEAFTSKGRLSAWVRRIPVLVALDLDVGLKGAARYGKTMLLER